MSSGLPCMVRPRRYPPDAFLMIFPLWNGLEMWHWGDSLSMGQGFFEFFIAPVLRVVGVVLILAAVGRRLPFSTKDLTCHVPRTAAVS